MPLATCDEEQLEIKLLLEALYHCHGYDFRQYAYASIRRRILLHLKNNQLETISSLQHHIIYSRHAADRLLIDLSINVTEMFRDPLFFQYLRQQILPLLQHTEYLKIWHAGCSSGEEAYSMAIILNELNLLSKSQIYATDFNNKILSKAKQGIIQLKNMRLHIKNYIDAGGTEQFADYYNAKHNYAILSQKLKKKIIFSHHNLVSDAVFSSVDLIICRNVLIYFDKALQQKVFQLFNESLNIGGYLCLGSHETLCFSPLSKQFKTCSETLKIYQKKADKQL